jgi:hypothetical protein
MISQEPARCLMKIFSADLTPKRSQAMNVGRRDTTAANVHGHSTSASTA